MKISEKLKNNKPYFNAIWELSVLSKDLDEWKNKIKMIDYIINYYRKNNLLKCFSFNKNKNIKHILDNESFKIIKILRNKNINIIKYILYKYERKIFKKYNILNIKIISAFILKNIHKKKIINILSLKFKKKIFIKKIEINKKIIGGLIIKIKKNIIDFSIIYRLNKLKKTLLG
ncbi:ATP synthase F1 subunit delta [Candidatus Portiera aleyrodidarum]|uniref:ATP synthase subunit delta n=1 Tax=Candidatus Portiera aleyrodidarum TaxID=91844 RepID=A0A8D9JVV7_9GAMM|nr:ATP synthase F1 subunit delta [Candidatus Portiera aleyrodidarum]CEI58832.1 ATP synthase subunit delta [Candidatus Portiera aleyrodidarum]